MIILSWGRQVVAFVAGPPERTFPQQQLFSDVTAIQEMMVGHDHQSKTL